MPAGQSYTCSMSVVYLWLGHSCTLRKPTVVHQHAMLVAPEPCEPGTSRTWDLPDPDLADPGPSGRLPVNKFFVNIASYYCIRHSPFDAYKHC